MDKQLAQKYRARWQAVAEIELAEQRAATIELRWRQLNGIVRLAAELGLWPLEPDKDEDAVHQRWARLKEIYEREKGTDNP